MVRVAGSAFADAESKLEFELGFAVWKGPRAGDSAAVSVREREGDGESEGLAGWDAGRGAAGEG